MNENPNNESNLSSASNEKINLKHHKANSSLLAKENKDKEEENDEKVMTHHVIGCLQDKFPDTILLHQG